MSKKSPETEQKQATPLPETVTMANGHTMIQKRKLTLDATSIARLGQVLCRVDGEMEEITFPQLNPDGSKQKGVGLPITDVTTGEQAFLILNKLMYSALNRAGTPLKGRWFAFRDIGIKEGKRYRAVEVIEMEEAE